MTTTSEVFACSKACVEIAENIVREKIDSLKLPYHKRAMYSVTNIRHLQPIILDEVAFGFFDDTLIKLHTEVINEKPDENGDVITYTFKPILKDQNTVIWLNDESDEQLNGIPHLIARHVNKKFDEEKVIFLKVFPEDFVTTKNQILIMRKKMENKFKLKSND